MVDAIPSCIEEVGGKEELKCDDDGLGLTDWTVVVRNLELIVGAVEYMREWHSCRLQW